jgi:hypothetical protein
MNGGFTMKRLILTLSIVFTLVACEIKTYSVLIINASSKTVSFTYNDLEDTLVANTSKAYEALANTPSPQNINVPNGALSVTMNRKGDTFTFVDVEPIIFNVVNTLPFEITIKADSYIWDNNNNSFGLSIPAQEERTDVIYTEKPKFTATSEYPVIFDWNIIDLEELDGSGNPKKKLSLVIR